MNAHSRRGGVVIVHLPTPDEQLPSGPLWTVVDDDDGLAIASRPDHRSVVLLMRTAQEASALTTLRLAPAAARAAAAALLAAADHAEGQETTR
ncbi:hypothetical protein [Kutzneria sp. NPDC052558]|uniref:hypothetical protein n=1 Tax=Kutzneria sp. NPDC052558 TaxID=3364121 RepID=UPI0037C63FB3